jgi:hypothetical protein
LFFAEEFEDKGNNKITELRAILQRESQNYFTEIGAALTTVLPVLFKYCFKYCCSDRRKL